ncbi:hypothetical protein F5876DRAFT_90868 [Lentinula aff. lateritia]|uniref:Uncharacterized protein n=1 Tax=Lentinula aff. lateritia TaxID=2804960 RepID=A0ACC1TQ05_9AGAR|nr:hypothetical protein F5876DRAFT_90868 [Lentinula aff. lateritia]
MRHFIWSDLDYGSKVGLPELRIRNGKGIVSDFYSLTWSIITTGLYIENLGGVLLGPLAERSNGHVSRISLKDIGWWVRYILLKPRAKNSIATKMITIETFTKVTGIPATRKRMSVEEVPSYGSIYYKRRLRRERPYHKGNVCWNVQGLGRRSIDESMDWIRRVNPTEGYDDLFKLTTDANGDKIGIVKCAH